MSYEMNSGQNMAYPYPPPATTTVSMPKSRFSKWWPISFFIAAVLFFIIGGGLVGGWTASCVSDSSYSYYSSYSCGAEGMWYGAVACFALGGICKFVAWILFIVWCVKRSSRPSAVSYTYQPLTYANAPVAPTAAMPAAYQNAQPYGNPQQFQNAPPYQPAQPAQAHAAAPAHSKEGTNATKYCHQCGAGVTTPFCPNCGIQV
ncbi:hypothetical protein B0I37DRAFT_165838 [Chaetomium sp. MPI-CAGE-AT-0009]|nr:hypothetical protein B0I37DRAFT_165838 [Chaetomium sp. MPI-CAGE-AT-0009]